MTDGLEPEGGAARDSEAGDAIHIYWPKRWSLTTAPQTISDSDPESPMLHNTKIHTEQPTGSVGKNGF